MLVLFAQSARETEGLMKRAICDLLEGGQAFGWLQKWNDQSRARNATA